MQLAIDRVNVCLATMGLPAAEDLAIADSRYGRRTAVAFGLFELEHRLGLRRTCGTSEARPLVGERLALVESVLFDDAFGGDRSGAVGNSSTRRAAAGSVSRLF